MTTPPLAPVTMTPEVAAALRAPFPPEKIGKRPQPTCKACTDNRGTCNTHPQKKKCPECDAFVTPAHMHLDFVGHADTTDRLLEVDPLWNWEPFSLDQRGLPAMDENGGLWIRLTIAGQTRIGYGDAGGKRGANAVKEAIGDAIRNAAMRFGVALDLWRKEPPAADDGNNRNQQQATQQPAPAQAQRPTDPTLLNAIMTDIANAKTWPELSSVGNRIDAEIAAGRIAPADEETIRTVFMPKRDRFMAEQTAPAQTGADA